MNKTNGILFVSMTFLTWCLCGLTIVFGCLAFNDIVDVLLLNIMVLLAIIIFASYIINFYIVGFIRWLIERHIYKQFRRN